MPKFEVIVVIKCIAEAESADVINADLQRKKERKKELQMLVQAWMNQPPKEET